MNKIFTIGSCFANEIRKSLRKSGLIVYPNLENELLTYYNTYSLLYEFERPANLSEHFYQNSDGNWQNPFRRLFFSGKKSKLINATKVLDDMIDTWIFESEIFILTLGMTEVFINESGLVYSNHPQYGLHCRSGAKCSFYNSTKQDNYLNLKRIQEIISPKKLIITVSPIPLLRTFTGLSKKEANLISKTILRESVDLLENIEYFDSYEYALSLENIYKEDKRHIKEEVIDKIIERFYSKNYLN